MKGYALQAASAKRGESVVVLQAPELALDRHATSIETLEPLSVATDAGGTGIWPLLSRRSFERVTGPKTDFWLAQTVGILVATVGGALLLAERRDRITRELELLAAGSAAGLGLVDVVFALRGRIFKVYLLDAALEAAFLAGWLRSDRA